MPRIRQYKNFNWERDFRDETLGEESENQEDFEGRSWLSNATIIASLPTAQIKQAIQYHKQMVKILEGEICSRASQPMRSSHPNAAENLKSPHRFTRDQSSPGRTAKTRSRKSNVLQVSLKNIIKDKKLAAHLESVFSSMLKGAVK